MSKALETAVTREAEGCTVQVFVRDPKLAGKVATLTVEHHAKVKRSSPKHATRPLGTRKLTLAAGQNRIALGDMLDGVFAYRGSKLDIELRAKLVVDDGILFDTRVDVDLSPACQLPPRKAVPDDARSVHSPPDRFSFIANLRAIPGRARLLVIGMLVIGLPLLAVNALVGVRDEFVPESEVWFYDHTGDGESESPLMKALTGSGVVGLGLWLAIRRQLQKYMDFGASLPLDYLTPDARCDAALMFRGQSRVALEQVTARVVAYNREHGQYTATEGSGKSRRTVTRSFTDPGRGVVLFEQLLPHVPAGQPIAAWIGGEVEFRPMFEALYPPHMVTSSHGLSLQLEVQLLHPQFVDHDVELDPGPIDPRHFHAPRSASA